ncbi:arylsulfatase [Niabella terrae]
MKKFWFLSVLFAGLWNVSARGQLAPASKPNIVLILADDLGYGDLGCTGQRIIQTPRIDQLAATGMRFTNFYAGTSVCAPSRSSLMTGQHTGHTYIRGNKEIQPEGQEPLADSVVTLAGRLRQAGYTTGAFGKWGLGMVGSSGDPIKKGFDVFFGYNCQRQSHSYYPDHLWSNQTRVELKGNSSESRRTYAPALIQAQTLAFIEENKDRPFFLFVPTILPHAGLEGPDDQFYKMYAGKFPEQPYQRGGGSYASQAEPRAVYAAMVSRMDAYVGQILDQLETLGLASNTLVLFASDNGAHKEGGADPAFFNSNAGMRGLKRDLYEGGIKTPLIVRWPGKIKAGSRSGFIGAFWDIMPTLLEIIGAGTDPHTDGISFMPTLLGKRQATHPYLYWEFHEGGGRQAVRSGKWKAVRLNVSRDRNGPVELYNLEKDPKEQFDLAKAYPQVAARLEGYMRQAHRPSPLFPF